MLLNKFLSIFKKEKESEAEYVDLIQFMIESPLWDGTDTQIIECLPKDLSSSTLAYIRNNTKTTS